MQKALEAGGRPAGEPFVGIIPALSASFYYRHEGTGDLYARHLSLLMAPVTRTSILIGKLLPTYITVLLQMNVFGEGTSDRSTLSQQTSFPLLSSRNALTFAHSAQSQSERAFRPLGISSKGTTQNLTRTREPTKPPLQS